MRRKPQSCLDRTIQPKPQSSLWVPFPAYTFVNSKVREILPLSHTDMIWEGMLAHTLIRMGVKALALSPVSVKPTIAKNRIETVYNAEDWIKILMMFR